MLSDQFDMKDALTPGFEEPPSIREQLMEMTDPELMEIRDVIETLLPADNLSTIDLEKELVRQYRKVLHLQEQVLHDDEVPANQRAQVAGQVASTLQQLIKMQTEFHTSERFKAIENLLIKHLKTLPRDVAEKFVNEYEALVV
jgi:uncharacterized protein (UPF0147 family)